jgi:hypothetical protein
LENREHNPWIQIFHPRLIRKVWLNGDEAIIEFTRGTSGPKTLEQRNILLMMIERKIGEALNLTSEQHAKLNQKLPSFYFPPRNEKPFALE